MRFIQVTPIGQDHMQIINIDAIESLNATAAGTVMNMISGKQKIVQETLAQLQTKAAAATPF